MNQSSHANTELKYQEIVSQRFFEDFKRIEFPFVRKEHWGGDKPIIDEIFRGVKADSKYRHVADVSDGSMTVLVGIVARKSFD